MTVSFSRHNSGINPFAARILYYFMTQKGMVIMAQFSDSQKLIQSERLNELKKRWENAHGQKLTDQMIADSVHVSRETVTKWRGGKNRIDSACLPALCEFFSVPASYFAPRVPERLLVDEDFHRQLADECKRTAENIGLDDGFLSFIKSTQKLADSVISSACIDCIIQPDSNSVPEFDSLYQFISSTGAKIYLPDDSLYMLRLVQRDLSEYALFLIWKWSKRFERIYAAQKNAGEITVTGSGSYSKSGEKVPSAYDFFCSEMKK
jgi:hypothetical protein